MNTTLWELFCWFMLYLDLLCAIFAFSWVVSEIRLRHRHKVDWANFPLAVSFAVIGGFGAYIFASILSKGVI